MSVWNNVENCAMEIDEFPSDPIINLPKQKTCPHEICSVMPKSSLKKINYKVEFLGIQQGYGKRRPITQREVIPGDIPSSFMAEMKSRNTIAEVLSSNI